MTMVSVPVGDVSAPATKNPYMLKLQSICGEPALRLGEDRAAYCNLRDGFAEAIWPRDAVEAMWVQKLTDLTWESWRREKLKPALLRVAIPKAVSELRQTTREYLSGGNLAKDYVMGSSREKRRIESELAAFGYGADELNAKAYQLSSGELQQIERLDAATHARTLSILREIDRHRQWLASEARSREVAPGTPSPEPYQSDSR